MLLTYSPSQLALPALQRTRLPLVIWNTQELLAVDQSFTMADMVDNHGVHGTQDLANVLTRAGIRFDYVTSPVDDPQGLAGIGRLVRRGRGGAPAAFRANRDAGLSVPGHGRLRRGHDAPGGDARVFVDEPDRGGLHPACGARRTRADVARLVAEYRASYDVAADVTTRTWRPRRGPNWPCAA